MTEYLFGLITAYDMGDDVIYISKLVDPTEPKLFEKTIYDIDHEETHKVLRNLEGLEACRGLDRLSIILDGTGFPSRKRFIAWLRKQGFSHRVDEILETWH